MPHCNGDTLRAVMRELLERRAASEAAARLGNVPQTEPVDAPTPPRPVRTIATELDCWRRLGRRMLDPDDLGWACSQEVRQQVRNLLP